MPRRYYRRTRTVRPKKKWATNISRLVGDEVNTVTVLPKSEAQYTHYLYNSALVTNSATSSIPTPTILKCGNFKLKGDLRIGFQVASNVNVKLTGCVAYIVYIPEGFDVNAQVIYQHPEWIMAWTPVDMNLVTTSTSYSAQDVTKFSISSRLKRNLNSGDRVMLLMDVLLAPPASLTTTVDVTLEFIPAIGVQYWTCAN